MSNSLKEKITVLVNSCDAYDDLWMPFFTLYNKYWTIGGVRLILNTETKNYKFEGLNIECIHYSKSNASYGERMHYVLSRINTPYTVLLLDDFFLREPIDNEQIKNIIRWMDQDKSIVYFNCDDTPVYVNWDSDKYPGYHRIPRGNAYTLNMQAAIWRTDKLQKYWRYDVSPWEWEEFTNLVAGRNHKDEFYCVSKHGNGFCDYGHKEYQDSWGIVRSKWVRNDVVPLFKKEGIEVDFSKRGFLEEEKEISNCEVLRDSLKTLPDKSDLIKRCLNKSDVIKYFIFAKRNKALGLFKYGPDIMYIKYQLLKEKRKFIRSHPELANNVKG